MSNHGEMNKDYAKFYQKIVSKIIEVHDLSTFRRQFLELIDRILREHEETDPQLESIKALQIRAAELK